MQLDSRLYSESLGEETLDQSGEKGSPFDELADFDPLALHVGGQVLIDYKNLSLALPHIVEHLVLVQLDGTDGCLRLLYLAFDARIDLVYATQ